MDKNIIKIIGLLVGLVSLIALILIVTISGIHLGPFNVVSVGEIATQEQNIETAEINLEKTEAQYEVNIKSLETAKKEFETQKEKYELISDETLAVIKEATKEEQYLIEYLWITLGNYANAHDLSLAIVEPGGSATVNTSTSNVATDDVTSVSTGTGVSGNSSGVSSTNSVASTGSVTSGGTRNQYIRNINF